MSTSGINAHNSLPSSSEGYFNWENLPDPRIKRIMTTHLVNYVGERNPLRMMNKDWPDELHSCIKVSSDKISELKERVEQLKAIENTLLKHYDSTVYEEGKKLEAECQKLGKEVNKILERFNVPSLYLDRLEGRLKNEDKVTVSDLTGISLKAIPTVKVVNYSPRFSSSNPSNLEKLLSYARETSSEKEKIFEGFLQDNNLSIEFPCFKVELNDQVHVIVFRPNSHANEVQFLMIANEGELVYSVSNVISQQGNEIEGKPVFNGLVEHQDDYKKIKSAFASVQANLIEALKKNESTLLEETRQAVIFDKLEALDDKSQDAFLNSLVGMALHVLKQNTELMFNNKTSEADPTKDR